MLTSRHGYRIVRSHIPLALRSHTNRKCIRQFSNRTSTESIHMNENTTTKDFISKVATYFLESQTACRDKKCSQLRRHHGIVKDPTQCGEDSFFISPYVIGVADGVGGWNEKKVDPGAIARSLMKNSAKYVQMQGKEDKLETISTQDILTYGYEQALIDETVDAGSTTACIVKLTKSGQNEPVLEYSNLGDSGFIVIRNGEIIFRSKFQMYGRAPYQLAKIPPRFRSYGAIENKPTDADSGTVKVQNGDIIIVATDGVWDNFAPDLKAAPVSRPPMKAWQYYWKNETAALLDIKTDDLNEAANNIVLAALRHNLKPDDITVIVAKVVILDSKL